MESAQQSLSQARFDAGPVLDIYLASLEAWKKNFDAFAEASQQQTKQITKTQAASVTIESTSNQLEKTGADVFRRLIQEQVELCRFFGKRWEQYLSLPSDISRCHSPADLAQLQLAFLTKMAADYGIECRHFARTSQELVSELMAVQPISVMAKRLAQN